MAEKVRAGNIELLRIVAMFLVVLSHFYVHGNWPIIDELSLNNIAIYGLDVGKIGVTVFVLISGYFLINCSFDLVKLAKYVLQVWLYGIIILVVAYWGGTAVITPKYFWGSIMPFYSLNWFAKAYLLLYLLVPLLNRIIKKCSEKTLIKFIFCFSLFWNVLPALNLYEHGNLRISIIFIYCVGAYFRLYGCKCFEKISNAFALNFVSYACILITVTSLWYYKLLDEHFSSKPSSFLALNSIFVLLCGIGLFYTFKNIQIESKWVNKIAKTMFGVYLIHTNPLISSWLWNEVINVGRFYDSSLLIPISILFSVIVMCVCALLIIYG